MRGEGVCPFCHDCRESVRAEKEEEAEEFPFMLQCMMYVCNGEKATVVHDVPNGRHEERSEQTTCQIQK
jgi:hypothetical protein